jgi:hypothetical protein
LREGFPLSVKKHFISQERGGFLQRDGMGREGSKGLKSLLEGANGEKDKH